MYFAQQGSLNRSLAHAEDSRWKHKSLLCCQMGTLIFPTAHPDTSTVRILAGERDVVKPQGNHSDVSVFCCCWVFLFVCFFHLQAGIRGHLMQRVWPSMFTSWKPYWCLYWAAGVASGWFVTFGLALCTIYHWHSVQKLTLSITLEGSRIVQETSPHHLQQST